MDKPKRSSKQKQEMENLIQKREVLIDKQESIRMLREYPSFLKEIGGQEKLLSFIEDELLRTLIFECYFGNTIYSIEDIREFYKHHKNIVDKRLRKIFMSARDEVILNFYFRNKRKMWNLMDIMTEILLSYHAESIDTVVTWLDEASEDLKGARRDLRDHSYKRALNRLQRGVEVLIKAYAMHLGLKKEGELKRIRHVPLDVYVDLLKQSWVHKVKDIFKIKKDIKSSISVLEKFEVRVNEKNIDDIREEALEWDKSTDLFLKNYGKVNRKLRKSFSRWSIKYLLRYCDGYMDVKSYYYAWFGFSALLLPLSVSTQFYSSVFIYPDFERKLGIDYEETKLVKNLKKICYLLEENIKFLKKSFQQDKKLSYTFLCETLEYVLDDINQMYQEDEKLESIEKTVNSIKENSYVMGLIEKINNSKMSRRAKSFGVQTKKEIVG